MGAFDNIKNLFDEQVKHEQDVLKELDAKIKALEQMYGKFSSIAQRAMGAGASLGDTGSAGQKSSALSSMEADLKRVQEAIGGMQGKMSELDTKYKSITASISGMANAMNSVSENKMNTMLEQQVAVFSKLAAAIDAYNAALEKKAAAKEQDKAAKEQERAAKEQERAAKAAAKEQERAAKAAQQANYKKNTTVEGAMKFSSSARTYARELKAIQYLKAARLSLNSATEDGRKATQAINAEIERHTRNLQQAGVMSGNLQASHRRLLDIGGQLKRQLALLFSVTQIEGYINKVAQVRGEFELQQRSLQSLLGSKKDSDEIFSKTVALAVKSPYTIRQLNSYTKQLAAYRIENDKLYDTTKRLADVSAGLGVDMQRLILAYGQVKAAAFLRGCLGYDTEIVMYDGSRRKVQDVVAGDLLRGDDDKPRTVKELIRGKEQMYTVSGDGYSYRVNKNHILTLYSITKGNVADVYVMDYLKKPSDYLGVKFCNNKYKAYPIVIKEDEVDYYFGFVIDQNKRFLIGDNVVTHNTEVRQFTEAGVNMYSELQALFKERDNADYTTAQIVDMISKRKVTFEDVAQVMRRLTDEGGLFYNMQEIQANTLQGKIRNLQDKIDLMLNDIGKSAEGILKGTVDAVGVVIENWDKIAPTIMAAAAAFGVLKLQAALCSKKLIAFAAAELASVSAAQKSITVWNLVVAAWKRLSAGIAALGKTMQAFVMSNPLLAIATAVFAVAGKMALDLIEKQKRLNEVTKEYEEKEAGVNKIAAAYERLAAAAGKAGENIDTGNIDARRKELQKLIDKYKEETGEDIGIDVLNVDDKNLDETFNKVYKRITKFYQGVAAFKEAYIDVDSEISWGGLFGENISEDADDLADEMSHVSSAAQTYDRIIADIGAHYKSLTPELQKAYDVIAEGQDVVHGESQLEYMDRQYNYINAVINKLGERNSRGELVIGSWAKKFHDAIGKENLKFDWDELTKASAEFSYELGKIKERFETSGLTKEEIKVIIDTAAAENQWNEWHKKLAYRKFDVKVKADEEETEKQIKSIDRQVEDFFSEKTYTLNLDASVEGIDNAVEKLMKGISDELKSINASQEAIDTVSRRIKVGKERVTQEVSASEYDKIMGEGSAANKGATKYDKISLSDKDLLEYLKKKQKIDIDEFIAAGGDPNDIKKNKKNGKETRDILQERVKLLQKLNKEYEELRSNMEGSSRAAADVMANNKEGIAHTGLNLADGFVPSKENVIEKLKEIYPAIKDFGKRQDVWDAIGQYMNDIQLEGFNKKMEKAKEKVEELKSEFELFQKLREAGLSTRVIKTIMPGVPTSYEELDRGITSSYDSLRDSNGELGLKAQEAYEEARRKMAEDADKKLVESTEQLVKDYGEKLSEQLQLDMWYYKELSKIRAKNSKGEYIIGDEGTRTQMEENLHKTYNEKSSKNIWDEFKGTESYTRMFEDLENVGTSTLERLKRKIEGMRNSMKDLSPSEFKDMTTQIQKLEEQLTDRNPFSALIRSLKDISKLRKEGKTESFLNNDILDRQEENEGYKQQINDIETAINLKDGLIQKDAVSIEQQKRIEAYDAESIEALRDKKSLLQQNVSANEEVIRADEEGIDTYAQGRKSLQSTISAVKELGSKFKSLGSSLTEMLDSIGEDTDGTLGTFLEIGTTIGSLILQTIEFALQLKSAGEEAKSAMGIIGYILLAIEAIVSIISILAKSHDKSLEKKIEALKDDVDALSNAFEKLEKQMENAWSIGSLVEYRQGMEENIASQIQDYENMIALEKAKKKSDSDKIKEYEEAIDDLEEQLVELHENYLESLGGIGESGYKDAAQEFADAWVDAFNEGESGIDAMNESFDELIDNLVKKQAAQRLAKKFLEPLFTQIDKSLEDESEGGGVLTEAELDQINKIAGEAIPNLNDALTKMFANLGYAGTTSSNVANLQQGIEDITEEQAAAIESYVNSIRFFCASEQADVAAILLILQAQFGDANTSASNQMITELATQTKYLKSIEEKISTAATQGWKIKNL